MPKVAPKRKAANGFKLAAPLPMGEILQDLAKKNWKLGPSIGQGGFGEIYCAQEASAKKSSEYPYVIKIEPHTNGPLFVEMHFYMRNAKPEDVEDFKNRNSLKTFGMPLYLGSGSHEYNGEKYRFIVMEKFGTDLWKLFLEYNRIFPKSTVFKVGIQILDVLQYIHERGYVHADIKGANILMGLTKETKNKQVYLVDFGLACKYNSESEFKPNPKKAHDGTIEYLSRDAHKGVQTRRGDLEILAYNLVQWLGCVLPWEKNLTDPNTVHKIKEEYMTSVPKFIKACFEKRSPPGPIVDYLNYISTLNYDSVPDYKAIRKIFSSGLDPKDALGQPFNFSLIKTPVKRKAEEKKSQSPKRKPGRRKLVQEASEDEKENKEDDEESELLPSELREEHPASDNKEPTKLPSGRRGKAKINYSEASDDESKKPTKKKTVEKASSSKDEHVTGDNMDGFTDAMKEVMKKKMANGKKPKGRKKKTAEEDDTVKEKAVNKKGVKRENKAEPGSSKSQAENNVTVRPRRKHNPEPIIDYSDSE